ncbi:MAG TPA: TIR domain-containing protein, partial [Kiloniellales bacterium]
NPNVLIEIGAAMAFYGRRFILLVREGVKLPSNLQGLYEVRYAGDTLDAASTIKLLEAIKGTSRIMGCQQIRRAAMNSRGDR